MERTTGQRLRAVRETKGWTVLWLSVHFGVAERSAARWLAGENMRPDKYDLLVDIERGIESLANRGAK